MAKVSLRRARTVKRRYRNEETWRQGRTEVLAASWSHLVVQQRAVHSDVVIRQVQPVVPRTARPVKLRRVCRVAGFRSYQSVRARFTKPIIDSRAFILKARRPGVSGKYRKITKPSHSSCGHEFRNPSEPPLDLLCRGPSRARFTAAGPKSVGSVLPMVRGE